MRPIQKRLVIPTELLIELSPNTSLKFFNKCGTHVATGYRRVVIGKRGLYVEFHVSNIKFDNFYVPAEEVYRCDPKNRLVYYEKWRTNDDSYTKLYWQKRMVSYADYQIGMIYISPSELFLDTGQCVLSPR